MLWISKEKNVNNFNDKIQLKENQRYQQEWSDSEVFSIRLRKALIQLVIMIARGAGQEDRGLRSMQFFGVFLVCGS